MANLQDTTIPDLTVNGNFDGGDLSSSPIGVSGYKNDGGSAYTTVGNLNFNGIRTNRGITISNNNSRFTVPYDGYYAIYFRSIGGSTNDDTSVVYVRKNGANQLCRSYGRAVEFNYPMTLCFIVLDLVAGDYIEYYLGQGTLFASSSAYVQFGIYRIG